MDFHPFNCSGIMSEGHSAAGSTTKKFISLRLVVKLKNNIEKEIEAATHDTNYEISTTKFSRNGHRPLDRSGRLSS